MDNTGDVSDALIDEFADWLDERCPDLSAPGTSPAALLAAADRIEER
jgi:hypothetical protein